MPCEQEDVVQLVRELTQREMQVARHCRSALLETFLVLKTAMISRGIPVNINTQPCF